MGVPKLFRWIVERYPLILRNCKTFPTPVFDNLYLDFNGILHNATHPNEEKNIFDEKEIVFSVFSKLDDLVELISPKKLLFLALDGVAPRAKMNQQRQRRYKSIIGAQKKESSFDINSISPGTEFMDKITQHLKFFIQHKISTDSKWQTFRVILSGSEIYGEGEHKIMQFIRNEKMKKDYDPYTSHCLYGLDADLIMLGLSSHEPCFTILREKVLSKSKRRKAEEAFFNTKDISFQRTEEYQLLSISLLREYLQLEFQIFNNNLLEKLIDDFVFLCFLVGNDFIPSLNLFELDDGLSFILEEYKKYLKQSDTPIFLVDAEHSTVQWKKLGEILLALTPHENKVLIERQEPENKNETGSKEEELIQIELGLKRVLGAPEEKENLTEVKKLLGLETKESVETSQNLINPPVTNKVKQLLGITNNESTDELKQTYYVNKLQLKDKSEIESVVPSLCFHYVQGLVWVFRYYFCGIPSWKWFYPYHSSPFLSDLGQNLYDDKNDLVKQIEKFEFEFGEPLLPLEQLLAILPPSSKDLLPVAYQKLVCDPSSPISVFFPQEYSILSDDKGRSWKEIALIPFVDEIQLKEACRKISPQELSEDERKRNTFGNNYELYFDENSKDSPFESVFYSLVSETTIRCSCKIFEFELSKEPIIQKPHPNFRYLKQSIKGHPTFKMLDPIPNVSLRRVGVMSVGIPSKGETLVLQLFPNPIQNLKEESKNYINKSCLIGYPYYFEGIIKCIYTKNEAYHWVNSEFVKKPITINYEEESMKLKGEYLTKYGIDIIDSRFQNSNVPYLFEVTPLKGMTISEGMKKKYWGYVPILIPYQLVLKDPKYINHFLQDERWVEKKMELLDKFPIGSNVVLIRYPNYFGSTGVIIQSDTNQTLKVQLKTTLSPNSVYHSGIDFFSLTKQNYIASSDIAKKLGIQNLTLSRITGTLEVKVNHVLVDLGLGLKYSRQELLVLGYARRGISLKPKTPGEKAPSLPLPEKWSYSVEAENFIKSYKDAFPTLFDGVNQDPQKDIYEVNDLFPLPPTSDSKPSDEEIVRKVLEWLAANSPVLNLPLMPADSISLPTSIIHLIEEKTKQMAQYTSPVKTSNPITVSNKDLFLPVKSLSSFDLGDRVMYVKNNGKVPFGLTGTVVSLFNAQKLAEVVFDSEFLSATTLNGKCKTPKGATILYHHLFNMTQFRNTSPSTRSNNRKQSGSASKSSPSKNIYAHLEGSDNSDQ